MILREKEKGYHVAVIPRGKFGEFSKIKEEVAELEDAITQKVKILEHVELADLIGAIEGYAMAKHGLTLDDLIAMNRLTAKSFKDGTRKAREAHAAEEESQLRAPTLNHVLYVATHDNLRILQPGEYCLDQNPTDLADYSWKMIKGYTDAMVVGSTYAIFRHYGQS